MKEFIKKYWKTILFFSISGLIGGFFTGIFILDSYPKEIQDELINSINISGLGKMPIDIFLGITSAYQAFFYGLVLGVIGIILSKRIGLWKDENNLAKKPLIITIILAVFGGIMMIVPDLLFFGKYSDAIMNSYTTKPSIVFILASITYGAVIEEVMLRLFMMSLVAFILYKTFERKNDKPSTVILVIANVISSLLFALGHLPATFMMIGNSSLIIFRCILLNGFFGLIFGYLYRKYGLRYSMIAHAGCHIVSKLIWLLFI